jgi:hypothetical protein
VADINHPLQPVSPARALREIADAIPEDCRDHIVIIGSLAVGYHYFGSRAEMVVRTKDADCLLSPRATAIDAAVAITERLLAKGWRIRTGGEWAKPGNENTPEDKLPVVRLQPPGNSEWFIELLTVPESPADKGSHFARLETEHGHFGLCSLRFLSLTDYKPMATTLGIRVARSEMMALANLLEHPEIGTDTMSAGFAGRSDIKRSNKDLGRVVAIARLAIDRDEDALLSWPDHWREALQDRFPDEWRELARRAGWGLKALLESEQDLEQAWYTCVNGLLASKPPTLDQFRIAGQRLLRDAVEPLVR